VSENFAVLTSTCLLVPSDSVSRRTVLLMSIKFPSYLILLQNMISSLYKGSHFLVTRVVTFLLISNYCTYRRSLKAEKSVFENHIILQFRLDRILMV